jgi:hypothetical protein
VNEVSDERTFEQTGQDPVAASEHETAPSQDTQVFNGIGPVVGIGRLGTLQRMMGIEAAQPILDQMNASEQRHAKAVFRVLGRSTLRMR